jgi:lysozyme
MPKYISDDLKATLARALIKDEGERFMLYKDSEGILTIGVGRNIQERGISKDESELMLSNDINIVYNQALNNFPWFDSLNDTRKCVILNMLFNIGLTRLTGFKKMLAAIEAKDYKEAAVQMLDSKWAKQVKVRACRLAKEMQDGQ